MDDESLRLTRRYGVMVSAAAGVVAVVYAFGILRRSYWALALPMTAVIAAGAATSLWLGRMLMTTPEEPPDP